MAFSVSKSRPFRSLGLYKSTGKHAARRGSVPEPRLESAPVRRPAHAASLPRLTGPYAARPENGNCDSAGESVAGAAVTGDGTVADSDIAEEDATGKRAA